MLSVVSAQYLIDIQVRSAYTYPVKKQPCQIKW